MKDSETAEVTEIIGKCGCILRFYRAPNPVIMDEMICKEHYAQGCKSVLKIIEERLKRPSGDPVIHADPKIAPINGVYR